MKLGLLALVLGHAASSQSAPRCPRGTGISGHRRRPPLRGLRPAAKAVTGERPRTVSPLGWWPEPTVTVALARRWWPWAAGRRMSRLSDQGAQSQPEVGTSCLTLAVHLQIVNPKPEDTTRQWSVRCISFLCPCHSRLRDPRQGWRARWPPRALASPASSLRPFWNRGLAPPAPRGF